MCLSSLRCLSLQCFQMTFIFHRSRCLRFQAFLLVTESVGEEQCHWKFLESEALESITPFFPVNDPDPTLDEVAGFFDSFRTSHDIEVVASSSSGRKAEWEAERQSRRRMNIQSNLDSHWRKTVIQSCNVAGESPRSIVG
ncbi:hypothetical protein CPB84DRAFT_1752229 [Gymnopilus junonius]|uniref:Uncharacterized protein n=1 Tax=Gymnopilus junonius TaxID=109634 RepID=A0A9P5NDI1_GYMJU|nr:hypothetical protein CPB84DRAFT_1752229 [Gymnopilus junonius]